MLETAWMIERGRALPINGKASSKIGAAVPVGKIRPVLTLAGEPHHVVAALAAGSAGDQRGSSSRTSARLSLHPV
jgi:hypothetical protein